jgi:hypothetical protein
MHSRGGNSSSGPYNVGSPSTLCTGLLLRASAFAAGIRSHSGALSGSVSRLDPTSSLYGSSSAAVFLEGLGSGRLSDFFFFSRLIDTFGPNFGLLSTVLRLLA